VVHKAVIPALNGKTINILSSMVPHNKVHLNTALSMVRNNPLLLSHWHRKTIIPTTLPKAITSHPSSTARSNPLSNSNTINHPSTVLPKAAPHNSGKVPLSMASHHSITVVAVVEDLTMVAVAMKLLSWVHQFVWDLTIASETTWLKRAVASHSIQIIKVLLQFTSLSQRIKVIRRKVMEDSVHHLIPTHFPALIGVEEI
jgi:hypothetical protein